MIALSAIGVFSMKRTKSVVSLMYDSCFLAIGCKRESMNLEMRSVGPPFPFSVSQRIEFRYSGWILTIVEPLEVVSSMCLLAYSLLTISLTLLAVDTAIGSCRGL